MSQISETEKILKEKMSFKDYEKPKLKSLETPAAPTRRQQKKVKLTLYLTEEEEKLFNQIYIKRMQEGKKTDRSTIFSEAVKKLYEEVMG